MSDSDIDLDQILEEHDKEKSEIEAQDINQSQKLNPFMEKLLEKRNNFVQSFNNNVKIQSESIQIANEMEMQSNKMELEDENGIIQEVPQFVQSNLKKNYYFADVKKWINQQFQWDQDVMHESLNTFNIKKFRNNQRAIINCTMSGHDVLAIMPTGGGKSLTFQLPSVVQTGVTIVVMPLVSLIYDQCGQMNALKIKAYALTGSMTKEKISQIYRECRSKEDFPKILFVTPEKIQASDSFKSVMFDLYQSKKLIRFVIDEAHCVSNWGHEFRKDYLLLKQLRLNFPGVPILALTATATEKVKIDIINQLNMKNTLYFQSSFNRPNLIYEVRNKRSGKVIDTCRDMMEFIRDNYPNKSGIIYCNAQKQCEEVAQQMTNLGIKSKHYHAGMGEKYKNSVQDEWMQDDIQVIVATIAFGMGINKPNVRFVLHFTFSKSVENYYQEAGRAGRDGKALLILEKVHELHIQDCPITSQQLVTLLKGNKIKTKIKTYQLKFEQSMLNGYLKSWGQNEIQKMLQVLKQEQFLLERAKRKMGHTIMYLTILKASITKFKQLQEFKIEIYEEIKANLKNSGKDSGNKGAEVQKNQKKVIKLLAPADSVDVLNKINYGDLDEFQFQNSSNKKKENKKNKLNKDKNIINQQKINFNNFVNFKANQNSKGNSSYQQQNKQQIKNEEDQEQNGQDFLDIDMLENFAYDQKKKNMGSKYKNMTFSSPFKDLEQQRVIEIEEEQMLQYAKNKGKKIFDKETGFLNQNQFDILLDKLMEIRKHLFNIYKDQMGENLNIETFMATSIIEEMCKFLPQKFYDIAQNEYLKKVTILQSNGDDFLKVINQFIQTWNINKDDYVIFDVDDTNEENEEVFDYAQNRLDNGVVEEEENKEENIKERMEEEIDKQIDLDEDMQELLNQELNNFEMNNDQEYKNVNNNEITKIQGKQQNDQQNMEQQNNLQNNINSYQFNRTVYESDDDEDLDIDDILRQTQEEMENQKLSQQQNQMDFQNTLSQKQQKDTELKVDCGLKNEYQIQDQQKGESNKIVQENNEENYSKNQQNLQFIGGKRPFNQQEDEVLQQETNQQQSQNLQEINNLINKYNGNTLN
ncbi:P-loop containing nucleoside triphosphate hydrolase [Pseudocohnilembus persalinus]|uniref:DNA 3'-5' helicase n=1 Tax=Pseudocohnilembus persalinus TaxID=266149 RepID=A0A0V0R3H2_PSEPJ|nr:P-loop containing nucleoside triphosphate hydrolase [Pseudocohnilembus persalinus]|eukprot:KRX08880.1 P-loop containing nucleoside triphosphate hydrolase [Pseudocohnilembus persalinus]